MFKKIAIKSRANMFIKLSILLILFFVKHTKSTLSNEKEHSVFRIWPKNQTQLDYLIELERNATSLKWDSLDFWKSPKSINLPVDLMLEESVKKLILNNLKSKKIKFNPMIESVEELVNEEKVEMFNQNLHYGSDANDFFSNFHTLAEINKFVQNLAKTYPDRVQIEMIGKSTENRAINLMKIGLKNDVKEKKIIFIDAGIHAREWIAPSTALFIADQLVKGVDNDVQIRELMTQLDFYILPVVNVDGYVYSHTVSRLWRKTRSVYTDKFFGIVCVGVDLNRNFDFHWLEVGASSFTCSQAYAGPRAFSEPESRAVSKKIFELKDRIILYTALHSYSQLILFPFGYSKKPTEDYADLEQIARKASIEIKRTHGKIYRYGSSNILYSTSGGADDWVKGVAKVKYSFTMELRDQGNRGFLLPAREIIPTGEEIFAGIKNMTMEIGKEIGMKF